MTAFIVIIIQIKMCFAYRMGVSAGAAIVTITTSTVRQLATCHVQAMQHRFAVTSCSQAFIQVLYKVYNNVVAALQLGRFCQFPVCPIGSFGGNCLRNCHCEDDAVCSSAAGKCQNQCALGWVGSNCEVRGQ
jgi:hypothetical protein